MADVRLLIQEEGRSARNLIAFNVPVGTNNSDKNARKPPSVPKVAQSISVKRLIKNTARVRSASTGRDKRSELHARYWAFLFGNLQRAVDGIYQTCEEDENISECKEVILVLENYTRDFHNLIEWFKVKWAYETSPPPLRRTPLAWEVRKTSPCRIYNSSVKVSPTGSICRSPTETIAEHKTFLDNKISLIREEAVSKTVKNNKNQGSKNDNRLLKEKPTVIKSPLRSVLKRPLSSSDTKAGDLVKCATRVSNESDKSESVKKDLESVKNQINANQRDKKPVNKILPNSAPPKVRMKINAAKPAYSTVSKMKPVVMETPKIFRSKTTLGVRENPSVLNKPKPGTSVIVRHKMQGQVQNKIVGENEDISTSVEVLTRQSKQKPKEDGDGWQTVRGRYRRGSTHSLNMSTRFHKPSTATSLPALCIESPAEKNKKSCFTPDNCRQKRRSIGGKMGKNINNEAEKYKGDVEAKQKGTKERKNDTNPLETNSTSVIAAIFKSEAELLEKRIQQFMAAQAERERIILEEERRTEEADSQRSQQLSDEEAALQRQIQELESTEIDVDTETDETDGETVIEIEDDVNIPIAPLTVEIDDISLEDRYENMLEGMSWAERMDTLAQLQALVARHPGRALELHQKLSSPSRKRSLPETLRRYQAKQACAQHKRQTLLMEKSQRLRELLNKVEDVKSAKNQLIEDRRIRLESKLKRAEENRTQHLLEVVRKAHDEDSKLKEIAFINELEAQNKRHDFIALCQEQEERLQGIHEERQRRQEEKAAKEAAAEERRRALEAERQLRIQKMRQARREREERIGKMQLEREKERQELAREKARDREERLSALHAAQLANQEELQKKIAQKQQESARRHVENIEHIRQRAVESSIMRSEEVPPTLKSYPTSKQCSLCNKLIPNEVYLLSHLKGKTHLEAVRKIFDGKETSRDETQRFNIAQIRDVPTAINNDECKAAKEKQKALKRRSRKIKQRMTARSQEWENSQKSDPPATPVESMNKAKFRRNLKELDKLCQNQTKTAWSSGSTASLDRCLGEIARGFSKSCTLDQCAFYQLQGFETLTNLLNLGLNVQNASHTLSNKSIVSICRIYSSGVMNHPNNIEAILSSNKILVILDLLVQRLEAVTSLDDNSQVQEVSGNSSGNGSVVAAAMQLLCNLVPQVPFEKPSLQTRLQDIVGYLVTGGLVERVSRHSRALIESDFLLDQEKECPLLLSSYDLLSRFCLHLKRANCSNGPTEGARPLGTENSGSNGNCNGANSEHSTAEAHLLSCLLATEAAGAVGALYAAIALTAQNQKALSPTPNQTGPSAAAKNIAFRGLRLLKNVAQLDLYKLQELLGAEGTNLQWRLIASHLITRLSRDASEKSEVGGSQGSTSLQVLTELFSVLGYFSLNNQENQYLLQTAGSGPSVLQQLCTLPFPFYSDPRLASFTLPTLLAATHQNRDAMAVLSCELSYQLLEEFRDSDEGKLSPLVRLLGSTPSP